jgi:hypothetical protein
VKAASCMFKNLAAFSMLNVGNNPHNKSDNILNSCLAILLKSIRLSMEEFFSRYAYKMDIKFISEGNRNHQVSKTFIDDTVFNWTPSSVP